MVDFEDGGPLCYRCRQPGHLMRDCKVNLQHSKMQYIDEAPSDFIRMMNHHTQQQHKMKATLVGSTNETQITIGDHDFTALLDTGSSISTISRSAYDKFLSFYPLEPKALKGSAMRISLQHLVLAVIFFTCTTLTMASKDPYTYKDDSVIKSDDGVTPPLIAPGGLVIDGRRYSRVYASSNGFITIDNPETTFTPTSLNDRQTSSQTPFIAVYWTDLYPVTAEAGLYFDTYSTGDPLLTRATEDVRYLTRDTSFSATWTLVVTWHKTPLYCCKTGDYETVTFQAVLVADSSNTYVMVNYIDVNITSQKQNITIGWVANKTLCEDSVSFTDSAYRMSEQQSNTRDNDKKCFCGSFPCRYGGTCNDMEDSYNCTCTEGLAGRNCEIDTIDDCVNNTCDTNGTESCVDNVYNYTCSCKDGYSGRYCDLDIDECANNTCIDNQTVSCLDEVNRFTCVCVHGYSGRNCETDIDECAYDNCIAGHTDSCIDKVNDYTCICNPGYTGRDCETDINECSLGFCHPLNTQNCVDSVNNYDCQCKFGYTGSNCDIDIDFCYDYMYCNPSNTVSCVDMGTDYMCTCLPGYTGKGCYENIDECASNNACDTNNTVSCHDQVGSYSCVCLLGYTGQNCETEIDECSLYCHPSNTASCQDGLNSYTCECSVGYTGINCDTNIDDCINNNCILSNTANCLDGVNNYTCDCVAGFSGRHCEINIDECENCILSHSIYCNDFVNGYECQCHVGYAGVNCEIYIDICSSSSYICNPSGTAQCIDRRFDYSCICHDGYTGSGCFTNINECINNSCNTSYTASCRDEVNNYTCVCSDGYTGRYCETEIDECSNGYCNSSNTVSCIDGVNNYTCVCIEGYFGKNCDEQYHGNCFIFSVPLIVNITIQLWTFYEVNMV
ncbi:hypothetical protein FSP39_002721 [Pinctada imbricata]|uniref:Uncharacterized protein n=1 Tax=Pinctada imbricata TaxID=66713 RepID=A0AA88YA26_PINIB|nr:hypothetical protein FSP39_002721 [Pinctada imbricata]